MKTQAAVILLIAASSNQKKQISGTDYSKIDLTPVMAPKVSAWARVDQEKALSWPSPKPREQGPAAGE